MPNQVSRHPDSLQACDPIVDVDDYGFKLVAVGAKNLSEVAEKDQVKIVSARARILWSSEIAGAKAIGCPCDAWVYCKAPPICTELLAQY